MGTLLCNQCEEPLPDENAEGWDRALCPTCKEKLADRLMELLDAMINVRERT